MERVKDHLLLEEEFVQNQEMLRGGTKGGVEDRVAEERGRVDEFRGSPMGVGTLEEMIDDDHAIVSSATGPEYAFPMTPGGIRMLSNCRQILRLDHVFCRQGSP